MHNQKFYFIIALIITLAFSSKALASFTFTTNSITGTTASTIDLGASNNLFLQTSGGKVGIGTATPGQPLTILSGASSVLSILSTSGAAFLNQLYLGTDGSGSYISNKDIVTAASDAEYIYFFRRNPLSGNATITYAARSEHDFIVDAGATDATINHGAIFSIASPIADVTRTAQLISSKVLNYSSGTNTYDVFRIAETINTSGGTNTIRGIYYNPTLTSTTGTTHVAFQNTTGNVLLGTTSGSVGIGLTAPSYPLDVVGDINTSTLIRLGGQLTFSGTAPTVASGFGTSPSFATGSKAVAFDLNVGTGGSAQNGVITLPAAAHGWSCYVRDITNNASFVTDQTAYTTTSASFQNYSRTTGAAIAWTASDHLVGGCTAF